MSDNFMYKEAKRRVKRKKAFYKHLTFYLIVNGVFFFITLFNTGTFNWLYPAAFWGIGLVSHYFSVFGLPGTDRVGGTDWEAKEIRKEIEKMGGTYEDLPPDELELKELKKQKQGWDDSDLV